MCWTYKFINCFRIKFNKIIYKFYFLSKLKTNINIYVLIWHPTGVTRSLIAPFSAWSCTPAYSTVKHNTALKLNGQQQACVSFDVSPIVRTTAPRETVANVGRIQPLARARPTPTSVRSYESIMAYYAHTRRVAAAAIRVRGAVVKQRTWCARTRGRARVSCVQFGPRFCFFSTLPSPESNTAPPQPIFCALFFAALRTQHTRARISIVRVPNRF